MPMKGDFPRFTFHPENHYSGVRLQQGRVHLDADWNEQMEILAYEKEAIQTAFVGAAGTPKSGGGFQIGLPSSGSLDFTISAGRYYVGGRLCELGSSCTYL